MSVPRRGSRRIVVDGEGYRWRVRRRPTADQRTCRSPLWLAIAAESGGPALLVRLHQAHPSNAVGLRSEAVTPRAVAAYVRAGLRAGWAPSRPGPPKVVAARELGVAGAGPRTCPKGQHPPSRAELAALAGGSRRDTFRLAPARPFVAWPEGGGYCPCGIEINGVDLIELVRAAELPHTRRERAERAAAGEDVADEGDALAGQYLGFPASSLRLPCRALLDRPIDLVSHFVVATDDPRRGKAAVLGCTCGIAECWFLLVRITLLDEVVIWSDFEQFHRDWSYDLGPFVFDRAAYERALAGGDAPPR